MPREAEILVTRDGVFLVGDVQEPVKKATAGWGEFLAQGQTSGVRFT